MSFFGPTTADLAELWKAQPMYTYSRPIAQGWECPKCGRIYSPSMMMCSYCLPEAKQAVTTTSTNPQNRPLTCEDVGCPCVEKGNGE